MLIFLLSFYFCYDLINCDESFNAMFNESLIIDKYNQNLLQVNGFIKDVQKKLHEKSVLIEGHYKNETARDEEFVYDDITNWPRSKAPEIDQTDQTPNAKKKLSENFPSPQFNFSDRRQGLLHWLPPVFPDFKVPFPALVLPRLSSPFKYPRQRPELPYPGYLLRPVHSLYPRLPPSFLSDYRYQNIYLRPPDPYMPSPLYIPGPPRPKRLPFLYAVNHYLQENPRLLNPLLPAISPHISDPAVSPPPPVTIPSSTIWISTVGHNAKVWLEQIAPHTPINEKAKIPSKGQSSPDCSEKTTVPFNEDEHGFLNVFLPEKDEIKIQMNDRDKNWSSTTAGDVLHGKITVPKPSSTPFPKQRYLDLMKQLNEGYMMVFMLELCRMIAVKDRRAVGDVLYYTEMIYKSLWDTGRLDWIGDPLETVIRKLSVIKSGKDTDLVRIYASMMFHMLLQRKQVLSAEVNSIIDDAGLFYNDDEGDRLLHTLKQFEDYPKTTKNSYWLCDSLIESFLRPFRRLSGTRRHYLLIESINRALKQRFPLLMKKHNEETLADKASPKNGSRFRKRKRKRYHHPHKKNREKKRQRKLEYNNKNIYGKEYSQDIDVKETILRTMIPVTSDQARFRGVTKKSFETNNRRPTTTYLNLVTRSTRNRKPSYPKTSPFQEKLDSFDRNIYKSTKKTVRPHHHFSRKTSTVGHRPPLSVTTSTSPVLLTFRGFHSPNRSKRPWKEKNPFYQMKERLKESESKKKDKRLKLKAELLLKITGSSSYSDEEVSLTKNLNEALRYRNRAVDFVDETR